MPHPCSRLHRVGLVIVAVLAMTGAGLGHPSAASAADADLRIIGGNSASDVVCGNVAAAQELARQRKVAIQKNNCTAKAVGGSVTLQNVDIHISAGALALNRTNPVLAALQGPVPAVVEDRCENHRPDPGPGKQINKCWVLGQGGKVRLVNVKLLTALSDGSVLTRTLDSAAVPAGDAGSASAACVNVVNDALNQRDDCAGSANGGLWTMRGVDVVLRNADGSTSTRRAVTVEVRGGTARAAVYCFNVTDGSGRVVQINICNADAQGGEATLRNVTFHTSI